MKLNLYKNNRFKIPEKCHKNGIFFLLYFNLKEFNTKLEEIKAIAAEAQDDLKAEYRSQVQDLETKRDNYAIKFGQLKEASGQAWDDLKVGTERTWSELKYTIEVALTHFK